MRNTENSRSALESELQTLKSTSTTTSSEAESLRARISSLESANRDAVAVIESKSNANDNLAQDLQKQHQKSIELSQQISSLQQTIQNADSAASSARFREQSLTQELELTRRNNEWFEAELKMKAAEALKYRKEKGTRISELQRLNEEATSSLEALRRTEQGLRTRLDEMQKKAEESLVKIQQLQESAVTGEESFRQELESARRLAELQTQQTETHRNRITEIESELEKVKDDAADEVGRCHQQVDDERRNHEQAEQRITQLEAEIDRLEALGGSAQPQAGSVPVTPRRGLNGSLLAESGSPAQLGTPGSLRNKSSLTITQVLNDYYKAKGELATETRKRKHAQQECDEMLRSLEAKDPEIQELQEEHERLQQESIEMSKFIDKLGKEREQFKKDARKANSEASNAKAEGSILRQQLRDLSAQIKLLLYEMHAREKGYEALSAVERAQLERLARGEMDEEVLAGMTDTDQYISQRLTVFRDINELKERNEELLRITRTLGATMESEEARAKENQAAKDHDEVQSLRAKIENYKDELQSMITRSESYMKERDMFRRMLQHRGQLPPNSNLASMFGQSVDGNQNGLMQSTEQPPSGHDNANYAMLLRELQGHFDQYREEQAVDRRTMKEQASKLSSEKSSLQAEIAKASSHVSLANERYEMLHSNYIALQTENNEFQRRSQALSEAAAKQDLRTQQVAEDLIEAKGLVESMRNENANLKAEKKLWKDVQDRLSRDIESLMNERNRLNGLVSNQQTLLNERQLADSETRRRLSSQVESLEAELTTTKRKLNEEIEDNKKAQLRKEYDSQQNQKRIDDLVASLSQVREELVAAKTTRDHVQARVDELTIELQSAEERVQLLQPRPTPRSGSGTEPSVAENAHGGAANREQELAIEVSELKRDVELARTELENAKEQAEQYKAISQASEEELQSLNATQDQYREEMDRIIEEKDSKIRELQQRADDISSELTTTNTELTTLRNQQSEVARQFEEEKASLSTEISRLNDEIERHATAAQFHQQDLRAQAAIATKAQQDYENELVKHADAARLLQNLRAEHNQLKTQAATLRAEAESAKVTLSQSQSSWEERRSQFEQELSEAKRRKDDVSTQNKLLQQQLDSVGSQISALQQSRSAMGEDNTAGSPPMDSTSDRTVDGLRELNAFLRREKEIIEVQYDLKTQEAKRLQQKLKYTESQLEDNRLKLDQERRAHADVGQASINHTNLMEKLNELNLLRESNITLRNEARQAQSQLLEKSKRVEELVTQIQPLETRLAELEHATESMKEEHRLLDEDRNHWRKRTEDILSKYDRIDPVEMEKLKETIEALRNERDVLIEGQAPLQEKVQTFEGEKAGWLVSRQKLIDQAKERSRILTKDKNDRLLERDAAIQERDAIQQQLAPLQQELGVVNQDKAAAEQRLANAQQEIDSLKEQASQNPSKPAEAAPAVKPAENEALTQELAKLRESLNVVNQEKQQLESQLTDLRQQLSNANAQRDSAVAAATEASSKQAAPNTDTPMEVNEDGQITEFSQATLSDVEKKALEERIAAAEQKAQEYEAKAKEVEQSMEATIKTRSDKMKSLLNNKLIESKSTQRAELETEYKLKFEQDKQIWLAEMKATSPAAQPPVSVRTHNEAEEKAKTNNDPGPLVSNGVTFDAASVSESQVRDLLASNATVKGIVANNIKKKLEIETQKIKDEMQKKNEEAKASAVNMAEKKSALRINLGDNKLKQATAKLEVVETAAKETPQKPVIDVWEVAKDARPSAPTPAPPTTTVPTPASARPAPSGKTRHV